MNEHSSLDIGYKPYPSYQNTELDTVGIIPDSWTVRKLKHVASVKFSNVDKHTNENERPVRLCNYTDVYNNEVVSSNMELMEATADDREIKQFALKRGDVLITKDSEDWRDIAVPAYVGDSSEDILCGYHLAQIRPREEVVSGRFLSMCFNALSLIYQYKVASVGITRYGLGKYWIDNSLIPIPPLKEQAAITAFLCEETARIDELISKKERMIKLLQEKRQAIITHVVTKGLNPNAPMKDSGIDWLGYLPSHWLVKSMKHVVPNLTVGIVVTPAKYYEESGVPCLRSLNITTGLIDTDDLVFISEESNELHKKSKVYEGDIVVVRTGQAGTAAIIPKELDGINCIDLLIIRKSEMITPGFLYFFINSSVTRKQIDTQAVGAIQAHFNTTMLGNLVIPVPPVEEQESIEEYLNDRVGKVDQAIQRIESSIELTKEYSQALITAAVTGQIDVRGEVA